MKETITGVVLICVALIMLLLIIKHCKFGLFSCVSLYLFILTGGFGFSLINVEENQTMIILSVMN